MSGIHADLPLALGPAFLLLGLGLVVLALATYDAYRAYDGGRGGIDE